MPSKTQWETAERLILEYREHAESECDARSSYHALQRDDLEALKWRFTKQLIRQIRQGQKPPRV